MDHKHSMSCAEALLSLLAQLEQSQILNPHLILKLQLKLLYQKERISIASQVLNVQIIRPKPHICVLQKFFTLRETTAATSSEGPTEPEVTTATSSEGPTEPEASIATSASPQQGDLGFQALCQAWAWVAGLEPATVGSLKISGQIPYPLCHRHPIVRRRRRQRTRPTRIMTTTTSTTITGEEGKGEKEEKQKEDEKNE
ncbi:hypothetical protein PoB_005607700 [Plakobranchus ocellatus]|uniref:Uncharacterized protein n=1 Tax=Plakobranchus ocellatus TaxID=259542 RepID=A0AAV4CE13_9GAST|nr:hypothetical protein PoB_005607700 [Plakobranchus ocellatus]